MGFLRAAPRPSITLESLSSHGKVGYADGHERSPGAPQVARPEGPSIPGQQAATIINPGPATLFSGFPAADSSSAARLDSRDFVFDLAPEEREPRRLLVLFRSS